MRGHFLEVVAGGEGGAFGGDDDDAGGLVGGGFVQRGLQRGHQPGAERVAGVGAVEGQAQDGAFAAGKDERFGGGGVHR